MNTVIQRIAIAKSVGWKQVRICPCSMSLPRGENPKDNYDYHLPDYLHDLNAMHEAAMTLRLHQRNEYCVELRKIIMRDATVEQQDPDTGHLTDHAFYQATAAQRAEAYLRTIGKWVEA